MKKTKKQIMKKRWCQKVREDLGLSRRELSMMTGKTASSISSYETWTSSVAANMPSDAMLAIILLLMKIKEIKNDLTKIDLEEAYMENAKIKEIIREREAKRKSK